MAIDRCLLEPVLSTDGGPSSGVSQSRCKSVYGTESHAQVNTPKRREEKVHDVLCAQLTHDLFVIAKVLVAGRFPFCRLADYVNYNTYEYDSVYGAVIMAEPL